ncbi:MAG: cyclic nucleotide-binding domain-containing protein, partial [Actinobacteria bacterium]|nr:cyclic nucleotide-binding domain-containing protein [Actinomycetota bacterium]
PPRDVEDRLSQVPIFKSAERTDIQRLAAGTQLASYAADRKVIREGRIPSHLYIVTAGDLEVWTSGDQGGEQRKVNTLGPGDHFGEVGLFEGMPSTATVLTVTPVSLLRVSATAFLEVVGRSPAIRSALIESVGGALTRSHPTYQLAAQSAASELTPVQVLKETRDLLQSLDGPQRADLIDSLRKILAEEDS